MKIKLLNKIFKLNLQLYKIKIRFQIVIQNMLTLCNRIVNPRKENFLMFLAWSKNYKKYKLN